MSACFQREISSSRFIQASEQLAVPDIEGVPQIRAESRIGPRPSADSEIFSFCIAIYFGVIRGQDHAQPMLGDGSGSTDWENRLGYQTNDGFVLLFLKRGSQCGDSECGRIVLAQDIAGSSSARRVKSAVGAAWARIGRDRTGE